MNYISGLMFLGKVILLLLACLVVIKAWFWLVQKHFKIAVTIIILTFCLMVFLTGTKM